MGQNYAEIVEKLDQYYEAGRETLEGVALHAREQGLSRSFRGKDLAKVVGLSDARLIYDAEQGGELPSPKTAKGIRQGSSLSDVLMMQRYFKTQPWRHPDDPVAVISFTNFKGGCWKTTTSWYAGACYANQGFRVLLIDIDPQASLSLNCEKLPDFGVKVEDTLGPHLKDQADVSAKSLIQDTYLPNMKIIPSCLGLATVDLRLTAEMIQKTSADEKVEVLRRLKRVIDEVQEDFDIIIMDGTPSLGMLTMNIIAASNIIVAPVPTELTDFASTLAFCQLVAEQMDTVATVAEAAGLEPDGPQTFFLPTRFSPEGTKTAGSQEVLELIKETFGDQAFDTPIRKHDAAISNLSIHRRTAFDVNAANPACGSKARNAAIENFGQVFQELFDRAIAPTWVHGTDHMRATGRAI